MKKIYTKESCKALRSLESLEKNQARSQGFQIWNVSQVLDMHHLALSVHTSCSLCMHAPINILVLQLLAVLAQHLRGCWMKKQRCMCSFSTLGLCFPCRTETGVSGKSWPNYRSKNICRGNCRSLWSEGNATHETICFCLKFCLFCSPTGSYLNTSTQYTILVTITS